jgi:hypothetical protein
MEPFVLWPRVANPGAVLALRQGISYAAQVEQDTLSLRCDDAGADAVFGVDLRILFALLVGCCGFPVVRRLVGLGHAQLASYGGSNCEEE